MKALGYEDLLEQAARIDVRLGMDQVEVPKAVKRVAAREYVQEEKCKKKAKVEEVENIASADQHLETVNGTQAQAAIAA